jgi:hypothetical protein
MEPRAIISRVTDVQPHPNSDKLNIVSIGGKINVADQLAPGVPRYQVGDYAIMLVENLILPEWLLKHMGLWNDERGRGLLAGSKGNRTKSRKIVEILSEIALCKVIWQTTPVETITEGYVKCYSGIWLDGGDYTGLWVSINHATDILDPVLDGFDITSWLGVVPYEASK